MSKNRDYSMGGEHKWFLFMSSNTSKKEEWVSAVKEWVFQCIAMGE